LCPQKPKSTIFSLDKTALQKLIKREICSGYSPTEIFNKIVSEFDHVASRETTRNVKKWLKNVDDEDSDDYPWMLKPILQAIRHEFDKVNYEQRRERRCPDPFCKCQLSFLDERYSLDMATYYTKMAWSLYLIDNFYGQKRFNF
jgi:hypothetical protein